LGLRGVLNVQMIVAENGRLIVIEANPRASRTVPIVAKATGRDVVAAAVRCALGATLGEAGLDAGLAADGPMVAVKAPVDSLWRLPLARASGSGAAGHGEERPGRVWLAHMCTRRANNGRSTSDASHESRWGAGADPRAVCANIPRTSRRRIQPGPASRFGSATRP